MGWIEQGDGDYIAQKNQRIFDLEAKLLKMTTERDALMTALGWLTTATVDEMILHDARGLRPEMVKARQRVQELEGQLSIEQLTMWEKEDGLLLRVWEWMKRAESELVEMKLGSQS